MAIFYKHIKGCGANTQDRPDGQASSNDIWSWIEWGNQFITDNGDAARSSLPVLYINRQNDITGRISAGTIITSNARNQYITRPFTFKDTLTTEASLSCQRIFTNSSTFPTLVDKKLSTDENAICSSLDSSLFIKDVYFGYTSQTGTSIKTDLWWDSNNVWHWYFSSGSRIKLENAWKYDSTPLNNTISLEMSGSCQALFFTATSDKRAKKDIQKANFSGLEMVLQTPIYEFTYKDSQEPSIGVVAQEVQELDNMFNNFSLVDNPTASGENKDYMSVKEGKMVYILWKAIQEQQAIIDNLKQEIHNLQGGL